MGQVEWGSPLTLRIITGIVILQGVQYMKDQARAGVWYVRSGMEGREGLWEYDRTIFLAVCVCVCLDTHILPLREHTASCHPGI